MSRGGGGGWGQRTAVGQKVTLHIYDLSPANDYIQPFGLGLYHSGLVIGGSEYTFAGGAGIFDHTRDSPAPARASARPLTWACSRAAPRP